MWYEKQQYRFGVRRVKPLIWSQKYCNSGIEGQRHKSFQSLWVAPIGSQQLSLV